MQTVLEQGSIDKPLTFDIGLIQLSFIPVCSLNTCIISVKLCWGFAALQCFSFVKHSTASSSWSSSSTSSSSSSSSFFLPLHPALPSPTPSPSPTSSPSSPSPSSPFSSYSSSSSSSLSPSTSSSCSWTGSAGWLGSRVWRGRALPHTSYQPGQTSGRCAGSSEESSAGEISGEDTVTGMSIVIVTRNSTALSKRRWVLHRWFCIAQLHSAGYICTLASLYWTSMS